MVRVTLILLLVALSLHCSASPLHDMVSTGNHRKLQEVISLKHFDLNEIVKGNTPLTLAASKNDTVAVSLLVAAGADWSIENRRGEPPMQAAAALGAKEVVAWLLREGCTTVTGTNECGYSTIHFVARRGWSDLIGPLVALGADPNQQNCESVTPLDAALFHSDPGTYKALIEVGADPAMAPRLKCTATELGRTDLFKEETCNSKE